MSEKFEFQVNGKAVSVSPANEETPLLAMLRNELGLMGTRFGCGLKQCGCCMVLIDGQPEKSCAQAGCGAWPGKKITTVEGLGDPRAPRTRCNRPFSTSRPGSAASAFPAS